MERIKIGVALLIIGLFTVSFVLDMVPSVAYDPPIGIYPALMLSLGVVFGIDVSFKKTKGGEK